MKGTHHFGWQRAALLLLAVGLSLAVWVSGAQGTSAPAASPVGTKGPAAAAAADDAIPPGDVRYDRSPRDMDAADLQLVAENGQLALWADLATAAVCIEDLASGLCWWSNPPQPRYADFTTEATKTEMRSQLSVQYFDENDVSNTVPSANCVDAGSYEMLAVEDGLLVRYLFEGEREQFTVSLRYVLDGGDVTVALPLDGIEERGTAKIGAVALLPYLVSGAAGEDGYLLLPDGAGALMDFTLPRPFAEAYEQKVYGRDRAVSYRYDEGDKEQAYLPVYGVHRQGAGLLAVIEGNAAAASVCANGVGTLAEMGNAYVRFTMRQQDTAVIANKDWTYNEYTVSNPRMTGVTPALRLRPLAPGAGDYNGMAAAYRACLIERQGMRPAARRYSGSVEIFGKTSRSSAVFGLPFDRTVPVTTLEQAGAMLDEYAALGLDRLAVLLTGFDAPAPAGYSAKPRCARELGGGDGLRRLIEEHSAGGQLFYTAELARDFDDSRLFWRQSRFIKGLNHIVARGSGYSLSTYAQEEQGGWLWYRPALLKDHAQALLSAPMLAEERLGVSLATLGEALYSDYDDAGYTERARAMEETQQALSRFSSRPLAIAGGNTYAALAADIVYQIPVTSSRFDCTTRTVPFYSLVFYGYVNMTGQPLNLRSDWQAALLDCLEYGIGPHVQLTGIANTELLDTGLCRLLNTEYRRIGVEAGRVLLAYQAVAEQLTGCSMTAHVRQGAVTVIRYSNGAQLVINRGEAAVSIRGEDVSAMGFHLFV